mmetsp:Transcript_19725/g.27367  ORF Transcript_19725/g.27367 Transcript_19725/m.27367 type:complete len:218 (-) Transcript_19725:235-888(-)
MVFSSRTTTAATAAAIMAGSGASAFTFVTPKTSTSKTQLQMGLFDGVKDAFSAPALERSTIDAERETPIDRWMGWSVVSEADEQQKMGGQTPADFIDSMDATNYVAVELAKPMGIIFEENDEEFGGIFVQSLKEGGVADVNGNLKAGDQLVAVGTTKVAGVPFDEALGSIVETETPLVKLVVFRGTAKQFYGPTGASQEWLDDFVSKESVPVTQAAS